MTSARTALLALLGHPVAHSRSPAMMTRAFEHLGLDAAYLACDVDPARLTDAVRGLAALGARGANVTVPHKIAAVACCDELDASARAIGAVNTLRFDAGRVHGHNTDAPGAVDALRERGFDPRGTQVVVLGSGGAARAVAVGLAQAGCAHVTVRARSIARAGDVVRAVESVGGRGTASALEVTATSRADAIVQATSAGMHGGSGDDALIAALDGLNAGGFAMDVVYAPRETRWLAEARKRGLRPIDGLGMLAHQAARALALWFERDVSADILRRFLDVPEGAE